MEPASSVAVGKLDGVLQQLGSNQPGTFLEAQAIVENIRIKKGYLDPDFLKDIEQLRPEHQNFILQSFEDKRATEAAYTTRCDPISSLPAKTHPQ